MHTTAGSYTLVFQYSYTPQYSYSTPWKEFVLHEFSRMANPIIMYDKTVPVTNRLTLKRTGNKIEFFINHILAGEVQVYKDPPYTSMDPTEFFNKITGIGIITNGPHSGSVNKIAFSN